MKAFNVINEFVFFCYIIQFFLYILRELFLRMLQKVKTSFRIKNFVRLDTKL